jgi:hypothetical protein
MTGWASKQWEAVSHYIEADGTPACSKLRRNDGVPFLAPFLCKWVERRAHNHLCTYCRRTHQAICHCGRCSVERSGRKAATGRRTGLVG